MSRRRKVQVQCPACSHEQSVSAWHSINVTMNAKLREQFFAGEINVLVCKNCKFVGELPLSLLYHDVNLKFMAYYIPAYQLEEDDLYKTFKTDGTFASPLPGNDADTANPYGPHIVFSMRELRRYVIFREHLAGRGAAD